MDVLRRSAFLVVLVISLLTFLPAAGKAICTDLPLTKTEIVLKAFEALKERAIGLASYDNLYVKVERDGCGYRVVIRDDPPKPSGVISVDLAPNGAVRQVNLD